LFYQFEKLKQDDPLYHKSYLYQLTKFFLKAFIIQILHKKTKDNDISYQLPIYCYNFKNIIRKEFKMSTITVLHTLLNVHTMTFSRYLN